jgi:hypothetical protein
VSYHDIEFTATLEASSPQGPSRPLLLLRGDRRRVRLRPHVVEGTGGPVEVADLSFEDGIVVHDVPFASFRFVEQPEDRVGDRPAKRDAGGRPPSRRAVRSVVQGAVFVAASSVATAVVLVLVPLLLACPRRLYALALLGAAAGAVLGIACSWSRPRRS